MDNSLKTKAEEIIAILDKLPMVKGCMVYGSLMKNTHDDLSDIDIEIDVSGHDNGQFMLELPDLLEDKLHICYSDYAPSQIPDKYIVSLAIDETNPFMIVDFCCTAQPHCTTVSRQQANERNDKVAHLLKLWTANLKHYARARECRQDIVHMAEKLNLEGIGQKTEADMLEETLVWLEKHADTELRRLVESCRGWFEKLVV